MADSGQQLIEAAIAATNRRALELVEQARQRRERDRRQRVELAAARRAGLARRHAQRLRNQGTTDDTDLAGPRGTGVVQDAHRRAGTHAPGDDHV